LILRSWPCREFVFPDIVLFMGVRLPAVWAFRMQSREIIDE